MQQLFRHLFVPHHTNNFRAKVLQHDFFAYYILLFIGLALLTQVSRRLDSNILGFATNIQLDALVSITNEKRATAGLKPLKLNQLLSQAAAGKAADMFGGNYWAHVSPSGKTPWDFIHGAGYTYTVAGENLAKNFSDSSGVVEAWINSPTHRENILRSQYEDVGFAIVNGRLNGEETTLVVQMFGKQLATAEPLAMVQTPPETAQLQSEEQPEPFASPSPTPQAVAVLLNPPPPALNVASAVIKSPLIDVGFVSKNLSIVFLLILMVVLVIDGLFVWKHKIVRIGGKNFAHVFFLFGITGLIWLVSFGSIL